MAVVIFQVLGNTAFLLGTLVLGRYLRRNPIRGAAERTSRVSHGLYWLGQVLPGTIGVFYPGLMNFDEILDLPALPARPVLLGLGFVAVLAGVGLSFAAQMALRNLGEGANAFRLTQRLVEGNIYARSRNPMSLGYYLICVGIGLMAGSTYVTFGSLLGVVPAHLFNLVYFEEYELALRLGPTYREYKRSVPFLIPRLGTGGSQA
jgi:protein-S-isoprenylcysteine O-methyltransferase Ste14